MRKFAFLLLLLASASPLFAGHQVTISQLEQQLIALRAKPDAEAARLLEEYQLTERLSPARLAQIEKDVPGEKTRQVLLVLADVSEFLPPSAGEVLERAAPDLAEQKHIMGLVVGYVKNTIPQLPNFLATRVTEQFEDTPLIQSPAGFIPYEPLHYAGNESAEVHYQDGRESTEGNMRVASTMKEGLSTWGVFGPIVSLVLVDAAQSSLAWSRWEQGPDGALAVFKYAVPKAKSHYEVNYCCVAEQAGSIAANMFPFKQLVGYHGEMAVDPATGAIRRLVLLAEMKTGDPVAKADLLVEFGLVEIGGRTYVCPVHSVSVSLAQSVQADPRYHFALARQLQPLKNRVSDVVFEKYHVFRAETHVLAEGELPAPGAQPAATAAATPATPAANPGAPTNAASAATTIQPTAPVASSVTTAEVTAPIVPTPQPPVPETRVADTVAIPETPAQAQSEGSGFVIHSTSRLVDVAVVAFDKKGHPVTDLKPGDLEIYDNGRKQETKFFSQAGTAASGAPPAAPLAARSGEAAGAEAAITNRPPDAKGTGTAEGNSTVLLIDAGSVAWADLNYAKSEMQRFLKKISADEPVGLYILKVHGFQVLLEPTTDHALVSAALTKWMPSAQDLQRAQEQEQRNRQTFDWVHRATDMAFVNGNGQGGNDPEMYSSGGQGLAAPDYPPDAELRPLGDRPEDFALHLLVGVGRHLAAIPGHKTLVWISSDNVLADFSSGAVGREDTGNRFLDQAAVRARETLNEAHVSIYPLDASQLETSVVTADMRNRTIVPVGMSQRDSNLAPMGDMSSVGNNGRDTARMQEDTHPIQGAFRDLAAATGGRALRRAGDIAAELESIVADGRAAYLVSFSPDTPADDKYHTLTVKTARPGITLRYRTGYMYLKEPATMKDRIREAVWQPRELNEIGLKAAAPSNDVIKLNVAAMDLALAQKGERWTDKLDIFVVLRDDSGLHATMSGRTMELELRPATYQRVLNEGLEVDQPLPPNPEGRAVRILVIDENSRRMGSITIPAEPIARN
jgi:VWFA-related protein